MKTTFTRSSLIIFALLLGTVSFSQTPSWQWAKKAGGTDSENTLDNCTDPNGNLYVVGYFRSSTINFGAGLLVNAATTLEDVYIVKYDSMGTALWSKRFGSTGNERATSCKTDAAGNIYITGTFASTTIVVGTTTLTNTGGSNNVFVAKYDPSGNVVWAKSITGNGNITSAGIAADAAGNTFITGVNGAPVLTAGSFTTSQQGYYLIKFDPSGNALWLKQATAGAGAGTAAAIDGSGNVYVTGIHVNAITFGTYTSNNSSSTLNRVFLVKYDASGNFLWGNSGGGTGDNISTGICVDNSSNVIVCGYFNGGNIAFTFVPGSCSNTSSGFEDIFIVRYNSAGTTGKILGAAGQGNNNERAEKVTTDVTGSIYVTGYFYSPAFEVTFNPPTILNSGGPTYSDAFILKYDIVSNTPNWLLGIGSNLNDIGWCITSSPGGNIYVAGSFEGTSIALGTTTLTNANSGPGLRDIFIGKLYNCLSAPAQPSVINGNNSICPNSSQSYSINPVVGATNYNWSMPTGWTGTITANSLSGLSGSSGNINVTVQNACGISPIKSLSVTVNPLPTITAISTTTLLCIGQTATITGSGASTYTWNPGGPGTSIVVSPSVTSTYTIDGTDANGCMNTSSFTQSVSACTGIDQLSNSISELNIYPNPFSGKITVVSDSKQSVEIFNSFGMLILNTPIETERTEINLSEQPSGIYFVRMGSSTKKIIKE